MFDCFECKIKGDKVYCAKGYSLRNPFKTIDIIQVARGDPLRYKVCQKCKDFSPFDDPPVILDEDKGWLALEELKRKEVDNC